jgi:hypothetical protein
MNTQLFEKLWIERPPGQGPFEWRMLLEFLWAFFKIRNIEHPIIIEVGIRRGAQKRFYEQLLGARHIGIDISDKYIKPDILGNSRDIRVRNELESILGARKANLIFIDGDHTYEGAKRDYEIYGPLSDDLIIFHDIKSKRHGVRELWKFLSTLDNNWTSKRTIEIGYATGIIVLSPGEKIYQRFKPRDKKFSDAFF